MKSHKRSESESKRWPVVHSTALRGCLTLTCGILFATMGCDAQVGSLCREPATGRCFVDDPELEIAIDTGGGKVVPVEELPSARWALSSPVAVSGCTDPDAMCEGPRVTGDGFATIEWPSVERGNSGTIFHWDPSGEFKSSDRFTLPRDQTLEDVSFLGEQVTAYASTNATGMLLDLRASSQAVQVEPPWAEHHPEEVRPWDIQMTPDGGAVLLQEIDGTTHVWKVGRDGTMQWSHDDLARFFELDEDDPRPQRIEISVSSGTGETLVYRVYLDHREIHYVRLDADGELTQLVWASIAKGDSAHARLLPSGAVAINTRDMFGNTSVRYLGRDVENRWLVEFERREFTLSEFIAVLETDEGGVVAVLTHGSAEETRAAACHITPDGKDVQCWDVGETAELWSSPHARPPAPGLPRAALVDDTLLLHDDRHGLRGFTLEAPEWEVP